MKRRWFAAALVGYILMFFSEFLFVNIYESSAGDLLAGVIPMWIAYTLEAYVFLAIVAHFRIRTLWALFLAGATYGWLLEGVVVQEMYLAFPFQVPFTGLSWHALIDVLVGWYLVRKILFTDAPRRTAGIAAGIGLFWSFWAIWAWQEFDLLTVGEFTLFACATALPLIPVYWLLNRLEPLVFTPHTWELRVLAGLHGVVFVFVVIMIPYAILVLPPLLYLIFRALRHHRALAIPDRISPAFVGPVRLENHLWLALIPAVASVTYALYLALGTRLETNAIVWLATVPVSVVVFVLSLRRAGRVPKPADQGVLSRTINAWWYRYSR